MKGYNKKKLYENIKKEQGISAQKHKTLKSNIWDKEIKERTGRTFFFNIKFQRQ